MNTWIISLGAGVEQLPLIRAIQSEGHKCLAFDKDENAPGKDVADHFAPISNRDVDEIERLANGWVGIAGVMSAGSEVPDVMAILGHRLGCPNIPVAAGLLLKDKLRYKEVLKSAGVRHTEAVEPDGISPVVVKPRVSAGSREVELYEAGFPLVPSRVTHMIERYQPGPQVSSETLIWDGMACTVAFADRLYDRFAHEIGVATPSVHADKIPATTALAAAAARALGIVRGTIKCDLVITDSGPVIIELTARLSGGPLCALVERSTGINYFRQAVRIARSSEPNWGECELSWSGDPVAIGMHGHEKAMTWEESRKYIETEVGTCV